jgi:ABC-type Fe2+-enterobactin transport system substrate-binding protein
MRDNHITANKIHHYARNMYDVAGIYTLSSQPGTIISNNVSIVFTKPLTRTILYIGFICIAMKDHPTSP